MDAETSEGSEEKKTRTLMNSCLVSFFLNSVEENGSNQDHYNCVRSWPEKLVWVGAVTVSHKSQEFVCCVGECKCEPSCLLPFTLPT